MKLHKAFISFFLISFFCFHAKADPEPALVQIEPGRINFGNVSEGEKVKGTFKIVNIGGSALILSRIVPDCGCVVVKSPIEPILPGTNADIEYEFDTSGFTGNEERHLLIFSNDLKFPFREFVLKGNVQSDVTITPPLLTFSNVVAGESYGRSAEVSVRFASPALADASEFSTESAAARVSSEKVNPLTRKVRVQLDKIDTAGEFRDRVIVSFKNKIHTALNIPLFARVEPALKVRPSYVNLGIVKSKKEIRKTIQIVNQTKKTVAVEDITSDNPGIAVLLPTSSLVLSPGKPFSFQVKIDPEKVASAVRGTLTIISEKDVGIPPVLVRVQGSSPPKQ